MPAANPLPNADLGRVAGNEFRLATDKTYTLPDLIDLAEQHNPETRVVWEAAKVQAGEVGIARSELYPTLAAAALGPTYHTGVLLYDSFVKQIVGIGQRELTLNYTLFDSARGSTESRENA